MNFIAHLFLSVENLNLNLIFGCNALPWGSTIISKYICFDESSGSSMLFISSSSSRGLNVFETSMLVQDSGTDP